MYHTLKQLPEGWYKKTLYTDIVIDENTILRKGQVENGVTSYWLYIKDVKTLIPMWFYEEVFSFAKYPVQTYWRYTYLNEKYEEYYIFEDSEHNIFTI